MKARLLDLGHVSFLHSQTIYHSVAYCTTEGSNGTIVVLTPREPYVSIGYHQLLEKEIDTDYCRGKGIPTIRREVGGGTVFLDKDQLFFQCVFPREKAPLRVDRLYEFFLQPAVNTYRSLGVDAYYRPVNDIQVDEKKISGTGAGRVGDASVVVGNIIFDFNYGEMSRVLRLSSEGFRDYETPGGHIRIILRRKNDTIDDIVISGDFNFQPKEELQHLEDQLAGQPLEAGLLLGAIESFYSEKGIQSPGVSPEDLVRAILRNRN